MEVFLFHKHRTFSTKTHFMNPISSKFHTKLRLFAPNFNRLSACPISQDTNHAIREPACKKTLPRGRSKGKTKVSVYALLKADWLRSLTHPFPEKPTLSSDSDNGAQQSNAGAEWVLGIDPDAGGAVAVLKPDGSGYSAEVFDSPHLQVLVGKSTKHRLNANSIVQLIQSFDAPLGTTAYIEQSMPYPKDGKQGWWSGGFGYGLWIGILVASGFSVVPVSPMIWKNKFKLAGNRSSKDDSRELASTLFPSVSSLLKRKKDHGRAEALLIAAYGKGLKMNSVSSCTSKEYKTKSLLAVAATNS